MAAKVVAAAKARRHLYLVARPDAAASEFGKTPYFTADEFEAMGYRMVIWPVSSLRVANKAQAKLYATLDRTARPKAVVGEMQTRAELYDTVGLDDFEALDASIVASVVPTLATE